MGKKHLPFKSQPESPATAVSLAEQAAAELAAGRFRKSRDLYKVLCKEDRAKYLPGLIAANRGLAEQLMAKGQISEAGQVIAYLKSITPAAELLGMEVRAAQRAQDWPRALRLAMDLWKAAGGALGEGDRDTVADALVLGFPESAKGVEPMLPEVLRMELEAVLDALRAISERRFEDAQNSLRPLPRSSLFAGWKTLAKAWIAFYSGEAAKARSHFSVLPPESVPGRAATAFRIFLEKADRPPGLECDEAVRSACDLSGQRALGPIIVGADQLWRAGRHGDSWKEMRRAPGFPSEEANLFGALSDFYSRAFSMLPPPAADRYLREMLELAKGRVAKNAVEQRFLGLALGRDALENSAPDAAEDWFRKFVEACPAGEERTDRMASRLLERVGQWRSQPDDIGPFGFGFGIRRGALRDAPGARRNLEESTRLDPSNLSAHLHLLKVYEHGKKTSERNRLLETMVRRFPEEKAVLFQAGRECLERGAYQKGLDALERARLLDPLDPAILEALAHGCAELGRQQYAKGNPAKARLTFERLVPYAHREGFDLQRGLPVLRARQGAFEMLFGDAEAGRQWMTTAFASGVPDSALLMVAHGFHRLYDPAKKPVTPFWAEMTTLPVETPDARSALFRAFIHVRELNLRLDWKAELAWVCAALAPVAGAAFTREEAASLCFLAQQAAGFQKLAKSLLAAGLRHDRQDPRFQLLAELAKPPFRSREKIEAIRLSASQRGDELTVKMATEVLKSIPVPPRFAFGENPDEDWKEWDDEDGFDAMDAEADIALGQIEEMKKAAEGLDDEDFARFRKDSAKIIPLPLFDLLIGTRGDTPKPSPRRRNPSQPELDLF